MKYTKLIELLLIGVVSFLCGILFYNLFRKIRSVLAWRVNCWFCNTNTWVKFPERNCWTCPRCEQYNGFNKDGDYNKSLFNASDHLSKTEKVYKLSPAKNGLCKMCNINQQLKVTQLANYIPMNDNNFDEEIESYRLQLERAYKLCSPCKRNVQMKLHKEKEALLGSKVVQARTPEKKRSKEPKTNERLKNLFNIITKVISVVLLALLSAECYNAIKNDKKLSITMINITDIAQSLYERALSIIKAKMLMTFPFIEAYMNDVKEFVENSVYLNDILVKYDNLEIETINKLNETIQGLLGGIACLLQILGHVMNVNDFKHACIFDVIWTVYVFACVAQPYALFTPISGGFIKIICIILVLTVLRIKSRKRATISLKIKTPPKRIKNLAKKTQVIEDSSSMDTDDDVSLTKFGLHNFTDSSNENAHINSFNSGRVFSPKVLDSAWMRPTLNSTFETSFTSRMSKSPSCVSETIFAKPSFDKYQNLTREDSDSDLDESISGLCISSAKKSKKKKTNSMFSLRKFTATPSFVTPLAAPALRKPLISPSKLGGTSWVAGGYWGADSLLPVGGSRSSSQSSGFESQASSANQRTAPSREESVYGDAERLLPTLAPVFPRMQYNQHVALPASRCESLASRQTSFASNHGSLAQPNGYIAAHNGSIAQPNGYLAAQQSSFASLHGSLASHNFVPSLFKAPGGLFKLPHQVSLLQANTQQ